MSPFLQRMAQSVLQPARAIRPVVSPFAPKPRHDVPVLGGEPAEIFPTLLPPPGRRTSQLGEPLGSNGSSEAIRESTSHAPPPLAPSSSAAATTGSTPSPPRMTAETVADTAQSAAAAKPLPLRRTLTADQALVPPEKPPEAGLADEQPAAMVTQQTAVAASLTRPRVPAAPDHGVYSGRHSDAADPGLALMVQRGLEARDGLTGPLLRGSIDRRAISPGSIDQRTISPTHSAAAPPRLAPRSVPFLRPPDPVAPDPAPPGSSAIAMPQDRARITEDIEIHIGRIEVTAVQPTPVRPPERPQRKAVSLDEYLRRRNGRP